MKYKKNIYDDFLHFSLSIFKSSYNFYRFIHLTNYYLFKKPESNHYLNAISFIYYIDTEN